MNGTKVVIVDIFKYTIVVSPITCLTQRYIVPRITFNFHLRGTIEITRRQFPLRPCYGVTFHRAQGQTLNRAALHLVKPVFTHGMLYVGLSRVRHRRDLLVYTTPDLITNGRARTENIVYNAILGDT
jgi:ATP-dependent DNA helicase PIF1